MTEQVLEFIDSVCTRPRMYASGGSYREITAFLMGYAAGLSASEAQRGEMGPLAELFDRFQYWLTTKLGRARNIGWPWVLEQAYPDDATRLKALALLLRECAAEVGSEAHEDDP